MFLSRLFQSLTSSQGTETSGPVELYFQLLPSTHTSVYAQGKGKLGIDRSGLTAASLWLFLSRIFQPLSSLPGSPWPVVILEDISTVHGPLSGPLTVCCRNHTAREMKVMGCPFCASSTLRLLGALAASSGSHVVNGALFLTLGLWRPSTVSLGLSAILVTEPETQTLRLR